MKRSICVCDLVKRYSPVLIYVLGQLYPAPLKDPSIMLTSSMVDPWHNWSCFIGKHPSFICLPQHEQNGPSSSLPIMRRQIGIIVEHLAVVFPQTHTSMIAIRLPRKVCHICTKDIYLNLKPLIPRCIGSGPVLPCTCGFNLYKKVVYLLFSVEVHLDHILMYVLLLDMCATWLLKACCYVCVWRAAEQTTEIFAESCTPVTNT